MRKYRISRDDMYPRFWAVQCWRWWFPFWTEEIGLLHSKYEAEAMIEILSGSVK